MGAPTFHAHALVLRKTKLGESDLICTLLAEDGSQLRVVAKGARKPTSIFSSRLELYSEVELLCAAGKNLDIVKEARLVSGHEALRTSLERAAGAACMAELLERVSQVNLPTPKLFAMTQVALACLARVDLAQVPLVTAAHLLKTLAFAGLRPSFTSCVSCGCDIDLAADVPEVRVSLAEGGAVCESCARVAQTVIMPAQTIAWAHAALASTFTQLEQFPPDVQLGIDLLHLCQQLIRDHVGSNMKSLRFLFTTGLF